MKQALSPYQIRVIGVLIEKETTTPDQYPLSLNGLVTGCNQKSSREPVLSLDEATVQQTVDELKALRLITEDSGYGSRVPKIKHRFCNTEFGDLQLTKQQLGILCVLFLRGPQTPGELRTRTNRLCEFSDVTEVERILEQMAQMAEPLVVKLNREPGKRDSRWAHLFGGEVDINTTVDTATTRPPSSSDMRIAALEEQVSDLTGELEQLQAKLSKVMAELGLQ